jgi:hypothetical protein
MPRAAQARGALAGLLARAACRFRAPAGSAPLPRRGDPERAPPPGPASVAQLPPPLAPRNRDGAISGRVTLSLSARHAPGWAGLLGGLRLAGSYLFTAHPLAMMTSSVKASATWDRLESEHREAVVRWLGEASPPIPAHVVKRVRGPGRPPRRGP